MKPTDESREAHGDFAGDESTSVMGVDLLSSLTERSRRIEVVSPTVPEPEISIVVDEVEPVTTMSPATRSQRLAADGEYPAIGDEESTDLMDEPEPTTVAVRSHLDRPPPAPAPLPARPFVAQPVPAPSVAAPAPSVAAPAPTAAVPAPSAAVPAPSLAAPAPLLPDPQWAAELRPRPLPTVRVLPLPAPQPDTAPESTPNPAVGSRRLSALAAVALGVAAWTLGLGHHDVMPASAIAWPAPSVSSAVAPSPGAAKILEAVRTALGSLFPSSASVASTRDESADPARPHQRPSSAPPRQRL